MNHTFSIKPDKRTLINAAIPALLIILCGIALSYWAAHQIDLRIRQSYSTIAHLIVKNGAINKIPELSFNPEDASSPLYLQIREQLIKTANNIQNNWPPAKNYIGIYSMKYRGDKLVFGPESIPIGDHNSSPLGTVYELPPRELLDSFVNGKAVVVGPYTDEYGTFISVFEPLLDQDSGKVAAVIGVDIEYTDWKQQLFIAGVVPVLLTVLLSTLVVILFVFYQHLVRTKNVLRDSEQLYKHLIENSPDAIFLIPAEGKNTGLIEATNYTAANMHGYSIDELSAMNISELHASPEKDDIRGLIKQLDKQDVLTYETIHRHKDGSTFPVEIKTQKILLNDQNYILKFDRNITDRKRAEEIEQLQEKKIRYLAYHDALTDLPNRTLFMDRLGQSLAQSDRDESRVAVLFADLDRFKTINDTLGHSVGDELLRQVARRMQSVLREGDTVARFGGDEFVILLPRIHSERDVTQVALKIIELLNQPFMVDKNELHTSTSIGISLFPRDGKDPVTLIKNADTALYKAKDQGRNHYQFFDASMNIQAQNRLLMENSLRTSLAKGELLLHYQPLMNLRTNKLAGVEALLRWNHPKRGLIPPGEFIPITEETGLISDIGAWVLHTACKEAIKWRNQGSGQLSLSVNLSARQLLRRDRLDEIINEVLSETGFPPTSLELEITESSIMADPDKAIETLYALGDMGIKLSIDDFGTGYSSLSYLKRLPLNSLKIDRSFVQLVPHDQNDIAIIQAILAMARQLKLKVIAEGIEKQEQFDFLQELGCDEAQGYFICKPLPFKECSKFLALT